MTEIHVAMVQALEAGATYRQAAARVGMNKVSAWRAFRLYKSKGIEAVRDLKPSAVAGTKRPIDPDYDVRWVQKVKANCVVDANGCWVWQGRLTVKGYGMTLYHDRTNGIHRVMYRLHHGVALKHEQYVLHRCDVRRCCNPDHLFLGTAKANNWDCALKGRHHHGRKTHCKHGHPLTGDNVRIDQQYKPNGGIRRVCLTCAKARASTPEAREKARERQRQYRAAQKVKP